MSNGSGTAPRPVFVDHTGSRRRWFAIFAVAGGALLTLASAMLIAGFLGGGPAHLPGLPTAPRPEPIVGQPPGGHQADHAPSSTPGGASRSPTPTGTGGPLVNPAGSVAPSAG